MERNYDVLIAEMLMSIDRHTEELTKQSGEMTRQSQEMTRYSQEMTRYSQEMTRQLKEQSQINEAVLNRLQDMEKIDNQLQEQLVHSATILDRIIKKNDLRV